MIDETIDKAISYLEEAKGSLDDAAGDEGDAQQEALDYAGIVAIRALGECLDLIDELRGEGAAIEEAPTELTALATLLANFGRIAAETIARLEMVEERIASR